MSDIARPEVYVLCTSPLQYDLWNTRALVHEDLAIKPVYPVGSAAALVHEIAAASEQPFVVCQDDIWFGLGFAEYGIQAVIDELNSTHPRWAVCANRGSRWDGRSIDYSRHAQISGVQTARHPEQLLLAGDNLLLINAPRLRQHEWKAQQEWQSVAAALPLSLECLRNGSPVFADPRLMTLRLTRQSAIQQRALTVQSAFTAFYYSNFINHSLATVDGTIDLSEGFEYNYLERPASGRADIIDLYDQVLARMHQDPPGRASLTLCCRTQFRRPEMLHRTLTSFAAARAEIQDLVDPVLAIITDQQPEAAAPVINQLQSVYPAANLQCWHHQIRPDRFSRADLLIAAVERATTDYIWFIDDDDYVLPGGARSIARDLKPGRDRLVVGDSLVMREQWSVPVRGGSVPGWRTLENATEERRFHAQHVFHALTGDNRTPVCSMILPAAEMRRRVAGKRAAGDYNEDYFLLLLLLTSPRIEVVPVQVPIAAISSRPQENTTAQTDKSRWHLSYCTFMQELLNDTEGASPILWNIGSLRR